MLWCCRDLCSLICRAHTQPPGESLWRLQQWEIGGGEKWHLGKVAQHCIPIWASCHPCEVCDSTVTLQGQPVAFTLHMCKSLHKAKCQVPAPGHQVCDNGTWGWVLRWHSLGTSSGIKTQPGCSDTLCVSWRFVNEIWVLYGKRVCVGWHLVIEGMEKDCSLIKILIPNLAIFLARSAACMYYFWFCELSGLTVISFFRNARKSS